MKAHDETRLDYRKRLQLAISGLFKGLPFRDRLIQGSLTALQAVCGASMAYWIGLAVHSHQAFWAAITAIAVTQHNYTDTMNLSRDQFIGAMMGGVFGFAGAALGGGTYPAYALTVVVVIITCWCLNIGSAARLGAVTATIVLLVPETGPIWDVPLVRLGAVTLGTVCAILVCWLFSKAEHRWFVRPASPTPSDHQPGR
jgi:uncharacterized membrane protein YgaE (UPF0421/DUF939 family)